MSGADTTTARRPGEAAAHIAAGDSAHHGSEPSVTGLASVPVGKHGAVVLGILAMAAFSLALRNAWQHRYDVWSDGVSYLDMADAFAKGDWATATNGYWSPLYPFLMGRILAFHPSPAVEGPAVQVLNLAILLLAAGAFSFLVRELGRFATPSLPPSGSRSAADRWGTAWVLIAAVIFSQTTIEEFIRNDVVSPDLCVAGAFFMATALVVRILRKGPATKTYVVLGVVLGFGYLVKVVFFPLGVLFVVAAFGAGGARAKAARGVGMSLAVIMLIAAPWVVTLSRAKARFTLGDAGRLNYAWFTNGVPAPPRYWQGGPAGAGTPVHPAPLLEKSPEIYEFDRPLPVTYSGWYEPSYWYEGLHLRFDARRQASRIWENARWFGHALGGVPAKDVSGMQASVVWGLAVLLLARGRAREIWGDARRFAWILLPTFGGVGLYLLVHAEGRYVGAMVAVLFLVAFALVRFRGTETRRLVTGMVTIILVIWFVRCAYSLSEWARTERRVDDRPLTDRWPLEVADGLHRIGVPPGARVAFVGKSPRFYWARLAGVRIVSSLSDASFVPGTPQTDQIGRFWLADTPSRQRVLEAFERAGAAIVVTDSPPAAEADLWRPLARSGLFARVLETGVIR